MKRYLVFAGERHEAGGGWHDFVRAFTHWDEANAEVVVREEKGEWAYVVDLAYLEIAYEPRWAPDWPYEDNGD